MKLIQSGIDLIKSFEGCKLESYPDPATGGDPWTIGYGCTNGVKPGMKITQEQAEQLFLAEITALEPKVRAKVSPDLTDNQFSAAMAFAYNMKRWSQTPLFAFLETGQIDRAEAHWTLYCKANGQEMEGLKRRRQAELDLFKAVV